MPCTSEVLKFDILLGDVRSLKQKRSTISPVVAELRRRFPVSVAQVGDQDLHRRAGIGLALVGSDPVHVHEVLDACERLLASCPEPELLAVRRRVRDDEDG